MQVRLMRQVRLIHSYERELIYLFVHSVFHLLGYDHEDEDEKKVMRDREENVMEMLGITR